MLANFATPTLPNVASMPTTRTSGEPTRETPVTVTGGTRGPALDAEDHVKAQAVILYWRMLHLGHGKMQAYEFAAEQTGNHPKSVMAWVKKEMEDGVGALASKRANCGRKSSYSPSKKTKLDAAMEEAEGELTLREAQEVLGVGSLNTAKAYLELSGWEKRRKRLKTLLTADHMKVVTIESFSTARRKSFLCNFTIRPVSSQRPQAVPDGHCVRGASLHRLIAPRYPSERIQL